MATHNLQAVSPLSAYTCLSSFVGMVPGDRVSRKRAYRNRVSEIHLTAIDASPLTPKPDQLWDLVCLCSKRSTDLQRALDSLTAIPGNFSEQDAISLFRQYVLEEHNGEQRKASGKLHLLTQSVQAALQDTLQSSNQMDRQLNSSRATIRAARQPEDLETTIEQLLQSIDQLATNNRDYRRVAQSADGEIDRLKSELTRLQRASDIDELTQLYNRSALFREINKLIANPQRHGEFCIVVMDIDHFKSVNDRFGHLMGDRVLQRIGSLLLQQFAPRHHGRAFWRRRVCDRLS